MLSLQLMHKMRTEKKPMQAIGDETKRYSFHTRLWSVNFVFCVCFFFFVFPYKNICLCPPNISMFENRPILLLKQEKSLTLLAFDNILMWNLLPLLDHYNCKRIIYSQVFSNIWQNLFFNKLEWIRSNVFLKVLQQLYVCKLFSDVLI